MLAAIEGDAPGVRRYRTSLVAALLLLSLVRVLKWSTFPGDWVTIVTWTSWVAFWLYRTSRTDTTATNDLLALLTLEISSFQWKSVSLKSFCTATWCSDPTTWEVLALLAVCATLAGIGVRREQNHQKSYLETIPEIEPFDDDFLRPMLLPCRITHTRLFPKRHSFSYSYLFVGIPVGWRGSIRGVLSADTQILPSEGRRSGWFHITGADYLDRDGSTLDLKAKLATYLQSQGENPGDYPHVYLVTAPKFLGYSFNPASFWYLYSELRHLKAMIVEVNNTFDERRMYFLKPPAATNSDTKPGHDVARDLMGIAEEILPKGQAANLQSTVFSDAWSKDFHVSPFNDREGSYSLAAHDPLTKSNKSKWIVDNTVILRSPETRPKIVARVFADGDPLDPQSASQLDLYRFVLRWCWVGFITFPRIIKEAYMLYFKRSLPVWYRPEIDKRSIARHPTSSEWIIQSFFQRYLEYLVKKADQPLSVVFVPPSGMGLRQVYKTTERHTEAPHPTVELHVLTPAFYSRFVHYAHNSEAVDRECLCTDELNRTVWISNAELLPALLEKRDTAITNRELAAHHPGERDTLERFRWFVLRKLRCPPPTPSYPANPIESSSFSKQDIRRMPFSDFDLFVRRRLEDSWKYRRTVTTLFLAQRLAFGIEDLIGAYDFLLRLTLLFLSWQFTSDAHRITIYAFPDRYVPPMFWPGLKLLLVNLVHIWALLK